jgi:hypothetical protein
VFISRLNSRNPCHLKSTTESAKVKSLENFSPSYPCLDLVIRLFAAWCGCRLRFSSPSSQSVMDPRCSISTRSFARVTLRVILYHFDRFIPHSPTRVLSPSFRYLPRCGFRHPSYPGHPTILLSAAYCPLPFPFTDSNAEAPLNSESFDYSNAEAPLNSESFDYSQFVNFEGLQQPSQQSKSLVIFAPLRAF